MKSCELCKSPARLYCESDQASLCWDCDFKVHGANFLVARHSRTLLCRACQSPTPWSASGAKLNTTVSVCQSCVGAGAGSLVEEEKVEVSCEESRGGGEIRDEINGEDDLSLDGDGDDEKEEEGEDEDDNDDDDEEGSYFEDEDEDDEDNQVVPWSNSSSQLPPPPPTSSSSSDDYSPIRQWGAAGDESPISVPLKRPREISSDPRFKEDQEWRRTRIEDDGEPVTGAGREDGDSVGSVRMFRCRRIEPLAVDRPVRDRTSSIIETIGRIQRRIASGPNASTAVTKLSELSKEPRSS